jgi:hypothetical protein
MLKPASFADGPIESLREREPIFDVNPLNRADRLHAKVPYGIGNGLGQQNSCPRQRVFFPRERAGWYSRISPNTPR